MTQSRQLCSKAKIMYLRFIVYATDDADRDIIKGRETDHKESISIPIGLLHISEVLKQTVILF